eukprot:g9722.t1
MSMSMSMSRSVTRSLALRRRLLPTFTFAAALLFLGAGLCSAKIEWSETTYSSSDNVLAAEVGELLTFVMEPGERTSIDFFGDPSDHFAVSYRQCSTDDPQPLQIQYSEKLNYTPFLGGCIYAENLIAKGRGTAGCTFWDFVQASYETNGIVYEDEEPLEPGRVRLENRGKQNATVEVAMFSIDDPAPAGLANEKMWIQDGFIKKDFVVNTSVNVYFNSDNYCDSYGCSLMGYLNEKVDDRESLSLCQVQANGSVVHNRADFDPYVELSFDIPQDNKGYYVTVVLIADETIRGEADFTAMKEFGLNQIMVFQTDTSLEDSSGRILAGLSLVTLAWVFMLNTLLSTLGSAGERETVVPALGW